MTATAGNVPSDVDPKGVYAETDMGYAGEGPFHYRLLSEPYLSKELARLALSKTHDIGHSREGKRRDVAYSVTFQPCPNPDSASQDRLSVESWAFQGGDWTFAAVFDGHGGHDAADYTVASLPSLIRSSLTSLLESQSTSTKPFSGPDPAAVSVLLSTTITSFDDGIKDDFLALFPGGEEQVAAMSDAEIKELVNDQDRGGKNAAIVARCMRGTTALIALVDPSRKNLWMANVGDCSAVLGEIDSSTQSNPPTTASETSKDTLGVKHHPMRSMLLNELHNGSNEKELERVVTEHPGEPECILRNRVLGALALTRALGDHDFKLPRIYTSRVFFNARDKFKTQTPMEEVEPRILTPPYVSNVPEVRHIALASAFNGGVRPSFEKRKDTGAGKGLLPTPLREDGPEEDTDEEEEGDEEGGVGVEVVPPTPKVDSAVTSFISDSESDDGEDGFKQDQNVAGQRASDTERGTLVSDAGASSLVRGDGKTRRFLILASDGLQYLYEDKIARDTWTNVVGEALLQADAQSAEGGKGSASESGAVVNPALSLLRNALGGTDPVLISRMLTVELEDRWMDDTTVIVLPL